MQSVLVIPVPEAEPLVAPFRNRYDSSAADAMPAHITINAPLLPGVKIDSGIIKTLARKFSDHQSFDFSLTAINRFPGVLYLEPDPDRPFRDLIEAVVKEFPQSPPYEGKFGDVPPHLTVAVAVDKDTLDEIDRQFAVACAGKLPIRASAREVWLMDNRDIRWIRRVSFRLAGKALS